VDPEGALRCRDIADPQSPGTDCELGAVLYSDAAAADRGTVSLALPLERLLPGGVKPDGRVFANLAAAPCGAGGTAVWVPTFGPYAEQFGRLRELVLEAPESLPTVRLSAAEMAALYGQELVARWRLDEGRGATVADSGPSHLDGTAMNGAAWEKGDRRPFLRLDDRLNQYVDLGSDPAVNLTGPLTLEAWVRYEASEVWYPGILGKGYEASGAYSLHVRPGLTLWFEIDEADGTRHHYNPTDRTLTPGAWCHVVATYDGRVMRVYINGREAGQGLPVAAAVRTTAEPLRIGWLGSYGYFSGGVRGVSVYRRGMAADEVFARYLGGR
jgi:hypothetical protein